MQDEPFPDRLAERWYEYHRLASGSRQERKALEHGEPRDVRAAHDRVAEQVDLGGRRAIEVLDLLANAAPSDDDGVTVGVGPIEDLLHLHGDDIVEALVDQARRSPVLARALDHAYLPGSLSASSLAQLEKFQGSRLS